MTNIKKTYCLLLLLLLGRNEKLKLKNVWPLQAGVRHALDLKVGRDGQARFKVPAAYGG